MTQYSLIQDQKKCIGCKACEIACLINKGLDIGSNPCLVLQIGPKWSGDLPRSSFVYLGCFHCEDPWCLNVCPTGAIKKREDGIVFIERDQCVGCKACITACPFGACQWDEKSKKAVKCDFCKDRVDQGLLPVCVTVCMTKCLNFEKAEKVSLGKREKLAEFMALVSI